jgi:hypothetical protein
MDLCIVSTRTNSAGRQAGGELTRCCDAIAKVPVDSPEPSPG